MNPSYILRRCLYLVCLLSGSLPALTQAAVPDVFSKTLDNGLDIFVQRDTRAPVVVHQIWYGVGAAHESPGLTGISHLLEHMMFRGTPKYPGESFSHAISAAGGRDNAFTGRDYTAYYQILGRDKLELAIEMEADRMRHASLDEKDFAKERKVVMEERRLRTEDQPEGLAFEELQATAFQNHPYGQPVVGWMEDLREITLEQLRDWYQRWYTPSNARIVVVGDIEPEEVFAMVEKHFGAIPVIAPPSLPVRSEPLQRGAREVHMQLPAQTEYVLIAFKTPALAQLPKKQQWEAYALSMLASVLDGGSASRLSKRLVRDQKVAAHAGASFALYTARNSMFVLDGTPSEGHSAADLHEALLAEIAQLQETPVTEAELQRAHAQVVAQAIYAQDSLRHRAYMLGMLETNGLGWEAERELAAHYKAVTAAQVQEVALRYFSDNARTTVTVKPIKPTRHAFSP